MLKPPYSRYNHLFVYNLDRTDIGDIDDPDHIGTWIEDDTAILFFHKQKGELINSICMKKEAKIIYKADLDYRDWESGLDITPFTVSPLHILPVWEDKETPAKSEMTDIVLDPSVIFGSGFHPTTRLCLEALRDLSLESGTDIGRVVDLGTGTGLLSIAAAKLGATEVTSYDYNPLACKVAEKNIQLNNCQDKITVQHCDLLTQLPPVNCDIVICNLYKGLLIHLFSNPDFWKSTYYLISGFIPSMEEELLAAMPVKKLALIDRRSSGNWRIWLLRNTATPTLPSMT